MNDKFDELAKGLAQSVTRRGVLKKFGLGLAGVALATFGLTNTAEAGSDNKCVNRCKNDCAKIYKRGTLNWEFCWTSCAGGCPTPI